MNRPRAAEVQALDGYRLLVTFDNADRLYEDSVPFTSSGKSRPER